MIEKFKHRTKMILIFLNISFWTGLNLTNKMLLIDQSFSNCAVIYFFY